MYHITITLDQNRVAEAAKQEGITMTPDHLVVVYLAHRCYCGDSTAMLLSLQNSMQLLWGFERGSFERLYQLFPKGISQTLKISGLA